VPDFKNLTHLWIPSYRAFFFFTIASHYTYVLGFKNLTKKERTAKKSDALFTHLG